jgi:hypothetical protein
MQTSRCPLINAGRRDGASGSAADLPGFILRLRAGSDSAGRPAPSAQEHRRALPCRPARPGGPGHEAASQRGPGGLHPSGLDQLLARPSVGARSNPRSRIRPLTVTRSSHASSPHSRRSSSRCVPCVTLRCRRNAPGVRGPTGRPSHGPRCWNDPSGGPDGTAALA